MLPCLCVSWLKCQPTRAQTFFLSLHFGFPRTQCHALHRVKVPITLYNCRQCVQPSEFYFSLLNSLLSTFLHRPQNCHSSHCLPQLFPTVGLIGCFQVLTLISNFALNTVVQIALFFFLLSNDFWVTVSKLMCSSQGYDHLEGIYHLLPGDCLEKLSPAMCASFPTAQAVAFFIFVLSSLMGRLWQV